MERVRSIWSGVARVEWDAASRAAPYDGGILTPNANGKAYADSSATASNGHDAARKASRLARNAPPVTSWDAVQRALSTSTIARRMPPVRRAEHQLSIKML